MRTVILVGSLIIASSLERVDKTKTPDAVCGFIWMLLVFSIIADISDFVMGR